MGVHGHTGSGPQPMCALLGAMHNGQLKRRPLDCQLTDRGSLHNTVWVASLALLRHRSSGLDRRRDDKTKPLLNLDYKHTNLKLRCRARFNRGT